MSKVAHLLRRHKHFWIASVSLCAVLATFMIHPNAALAGGLHWRQHQDRCAALTPRGPLYNNRGGLIVWPYGQQIGEFTWDGKHKIVACDNNNPSNPGPMGDNRAFYADGREARSGADYLGGGYGAAFQCEELVQRYAYARWGDAPDAWGHDAAATWAKHPGHFIAIPNGSVIPPVPGDILVWRSDHMAIVTSVEKHAVIIFQQNGYDPDLRPAMDGATGRVGYTLANGQYQIDIGDLYGWLHAPDNTGQHVAVLSTNTGIGGGKGTVPPQSPPPTASNGAPTHGASATWAATTYYTQSGKRAKIAVTLSFTRDASGNLWESQAPGKQTPGAAPAQLPIPAAPAPLVSDPIAAQDGDGVLWLYATGSDGTIYALPQDRVLQADGAALFTGAWRALPANPAGVAFAGQPMISAQQPASAQDTYGAKAVIVARDQQGAIWYLTTSHKTGMAAAWQALTLPSGDRSTFASDPVINIGPAGAFQVVALDAQGRAWFDQQHIDQRHAAWPVTWVGWQRLPATAAPLIGLPALGVTLPFIAPHTPHAAIIARGTDGQMYAIDLPLSKAPQWTRLPALTAGIASDPAIITTASGALAIVVAGADGQLWQVAETSGESWSTWSAIGAQAPTAPLVTAYRPAVIWNDAGVTILEHSADGAIWQATQDAHGVWQGWRELATLPSPDLGAIPTVAPNAPSSWVARVTTATGADEFFAFARTASGQITFTAHSAGAALARGALPGSVAFVGDPTAIVDANGTLTVYAIGADGALWEDSLNSPSTPLAERAWNGWVSMGAPLVASLSGTPSALDLPQSGDDPTAPGSAQRLIAVRDTAQRVWIWRQSVDGRQQFWQQITKPDGAGVPAASDPALALNLSQAAQVTSTDSQGVIWQARQTGVDPDGNMRWSGWQPALEGPVSFSRTPVVGSEFVAPQRAALVAQGADGALYARGQSDLDGWQPAPLPVPALPAGVTISGAPQLVPNATHTLDLYVVGSDGAVWRLSQTPTYSPSNVMAWGQWLRVGAPGTTFTGALGVVTDTAGQTVLIAQDEQGHIWEYATVTGAWSAWESAQS